MAEIKDMRSELIISIKKLREFHSIFKLKNYY